ncbi:MAG: DNA cytosine methyltransferase [Pseudomonadota bacterium]
MSTDSRPKLAEFFAGGGLAHMGLKDHFDCVFANDFDAMKCAAYRANFPDSRIDHSDVWTLRPGDLPDVDLAWASFPCQDLSLAGARKGLNAPRSGAFWGFWRQIEALTADDRAPKTLALENVAGLISSRGGKDFSALMETLTAAGYRAGAMLIDAALFSPQSRPRLFIVAHKGKIPAGLSGAPDPVFHPPLLKEAVERLEPEARLAWVWWRPPNPSARNTRLEDVLERDPPEKSWRKPEHCARLIEMMSPLHRARFDAALKDPTWRAGAVYRRMRPEYGRKVQRAEIRYDGLAGCLRTPAGGSSRQFLLITENGQARMRPLLAREAARLMGCDESYALPKSETAALKILGDGVSIPVVRWLGDHLLSPLAGGETARAQDAA